MPEPGMTGICLKQEVADLVRKRARDAGQGLNDYLSSLLLGSSLERLLPSGPSQQCIEDRPGTVPEPTTQQLLSLIQTLIQQNNQNQTQNPKQPIFGEAFCEQKGSVVRSPGFGPGFLPWQGNVLDQSSAKSTETLTWLDYDRTVNQLIGKTLKYLKDKGDCDKTLFVAKKKLTQIRKHADLRDPEGVKEYLQNAKLERGDNEGKPLSNPSKKKLADTYDNLVKANKMTWTKPKFKILENVPPIPTTDAVTRIISHCRSDYKTIFNMIKETGASPEELHSTPRSKICLETGQITIIGHKKHARAKGFHC